MAALARSGSQHETVNFERVFKQLRREATTNPKKAVVLGLLALVALWFWVPLMWGWISTGDAEAEDAVAARIGSSIRPDATLKETDESPKSKSKSKSIHPWRQLVQWMDNDPQTLPATLVSETRDPFRTPAVEVAEAEPIVEDEPEEVPLDVTPESLGMSLSSTIIGPRRRTARIDGKSYQQGKLVEVVSDGQQIQFELVEVHPRHVILEREGKRFELMTLPGATAGRIEVSRGTN